MSLSVGLLIGSPGADLVVTAIGVVAALFAIPGALVSRSEMSTVA